MPLSALNSERKTSRSHSYSESQDMAEQGIGSRLEMHSIADPSFNFETTSRPLTPPYSMTTDVEGLASSHRSTQYRRPYTSRLSLAYRYGGIDSQDASTQSKISFQSNKRREQMFTKLDMTDLDQPKGWSQVASFLESCDSFSIYRGFAPLHARVLLFRMNRILALQKILHELDVRDAKNGDKLDPLRHSPQAEALELERETITLSLEQELLAYGKSQLLVALFVLS
ncbi:hypothetical protein BPAE_0523g00020 [Botrytis paeoniae]|uniref:DUF6594 domain-containing protein n=1 Tax=Botrytis paeoniae TaxID=278948 RepID=A0A4Z1EXZ1_9HELO|nr:hypothetical protein BPAE_0523g00020 [Botrytis paeoniae]